MYDFLSSAGSKSYDSGGYKKAKQFYTGATYHITTYLWDGFDYLGEETL